MAVYKNTHAGSPIAGVEFTPVSDGNFSFFYVDNEADLAEVKQWLTSPDIGQEIIAEAQTASQPVLITHGGKAKDDLMALLEARGEKLELQKHKRSFADMAWPVRGALGFTGQTLQLSSSFLTKKGFAWDTGMFASLNLVANAMAMMFGAQRRPDDHKLRAIKTDINETLDDYVPGGGDTLPSIDEQRAYLRKDPEPPKSWWQKSKELLRDNSVLVGEVGLRFAAGLAVAFPVNKLSKGWAALKSGSVTKAYYVARNDAIITHWAGLGSLFGKAVALFSKSEDPYDPKPKSLLDTIREKYLFRTGGWIEAGAFSAQAYDNFTNTGETKKIRFRGKDSPNYIAGIGSSLFATGYVVRNWAKFGIKEMNMDEMYAHAVDGLAQVPPEQLSQRMAEVAADITDHFKGNRLSYGEAFRQLMNRLYRDQHIALDNLGTEPEERIAKTNSQAQAADMATKTGAVEVKHAINSPRKLTDRTSPPEVSYAEKAQSSEKPFPCLRV